jgi:hypothetical protein
MAIYEVLDSGFNKLVETSFGVEKIYERRDLQRLLKANIEVLSSVWRLERQQPPD